MTRPSGAKPRAPHLLLLAEDDRIAYRVLSAAVTSGARASVLGWQGGARLRRSRLVDRARAAQAAFDPARPDEAAAMIDECARDWGVDLVVPTNAATTRFLCAARDRLSVAPALPVPCPEVFDMLNDKARFATLLAQMGLPAPPTTSFASVAHLRAALRNGELQGVGMVKPPSASGAAGVHRLATGDDAGVLDRIDYSPVLWQRFVEGPTWSASALCLQGRMHGFVIYSRAQGVYTFLQDEDVRAQAARIVAATAFDGLINFDLIAPDGETPLWIECNPRVFYTLDIHAAAGLDYLAPVLARDTRARAAALARLDHRAAVLAGRRMRKMRASALALATGARLTSLDLGLAYRRLADPLFLARDRLQELRRRLAA